MLWKKNEGSMVVCTETESYDGTTCLLSLSLISIGALTRGPGLVPHLFNFSSVIILFSRSWLYLFSIIWLLTIFYGCFEWIFFIIWVVFLRLNQAKGVWIFNVSCKNALIAEFFLWSQVWFLCTLIFPVFLSYWKYFTDE